MIELVKLLEAGDIEWDVMEAAMEKVESLGSRV